MKYESADGALINKLTQQLNVYRVKNRQKEVYYEGENRLKNLNIALPPKYEKMHVAVAWPELVVERKCERINLNGFTAPKGIDFGTILSDNQLNSESKEAHRDCLLYGTAYAVAGYGDTSVNEPEILITIESPNNTVGTPNRRSRDLDNLLQVEYDKDGNPYKGVLHLRDKTIFFMYGNESNVMMPIPADPLMLSSQAEYTINIVKVDEHGRGFIPAVQFVNRPRSSRAEGQSEITKVIRSQTDQAVITFTEAALAREMYATPQRYALNMDTTAFKDKDGNPMPLWESYMTKIWMTGPTKSSGPNAVNPPNIGQFPAASPKPLLDLIAAFAEQISAASGVPLSQLGYTTVNPASADAIQAQNEVLVKTAEDRMDSFGIKWTQLIKMCLRLRDGDLPEGAAEIQPIWRSAATITRAADAVAISLLIKSGVIPAESEVALSRSDLTEAEKQIVREERIALKKEAKAKADALAAQMAANPPQQLDANGQPIANNQPPQLQQQAPQPPQAGKTPANGQ